MRTGDQTRRFRPPPARRRWLPSLLAIALPFVASIPARALTGEESIARRVAAALDEARAGAGLPALERRDGLDAAARRRAVEIAAMPHAQRLATGHSIDETLGAAGISGYRRASQHVDMNRGYRDPAAGFLRSWTSAKGSWRAATAPDWDAAGVGVATADDGWVVLVVVFVEDSPPPPDPAALEARAFDAVNAVRVADGLAPLTPDADLARVAREHSRDMLRLNYFDHRSPDGRGTVDRVRAAGIRYRRLSENIQKNRGADDAVTTAVDAWMNSDSHRRAILDPQVSLSGMGVAVGDDGTAIFTQLFLAPGPEPAPPATP